MDKSSRIPAWTEQPLPFSTTQLEADLRISLDGPGGAGHVGHRVRDCVRGELLVLGSTPFSTDRFTLEQLKHVLEELAEELWSMLEPF